MRNFLDKIRKRKLYEQWVNANGLPRDEIPPELQSSESYVEKVGTTNESTKNLHYINSPYLSIKWRYMVYMGLIIVILVIITSILATILVMKSC